MPGLEKLTRHIPNTATSLNLLAGFISILLTIEGNYLLASWFIFIAAFFDFSDGFLARMLRAYSDRTRTHSLDVARAIVLIISAGGQRYPAPELRSSPQQRIASENLWAAYASDALDRLLNSGKTGMVSAS